jgi:hypothetical protein
MYGLDWILLERGINICFGQTEQQFCSSPKLLLGLYRLILYGIVLVVSILSSWT